VRLSLQDLDARANASMQPLFEVIDVEAAELSLPSDLRAVSAAGFETRGDRLYLRAYAAQRGPAAESMNRWSAERYVNDIGLESGVDPSDSRWRPQLLGWGVVLGLTLLTDARRVTRGGAIQASIGLQSAGGSQNPDIDYAVGALHVYGIRRPEDDLGRQIESFEQPVLTLTTAAQPEL
jgi:hypothetical protein